jgi:ubiquinone/menaquinone biosynthesis C-methylase UbiE
MCWYSNQVLPRLQDIVMRRRALNAVRARVCADLEGEVLEIGFGTGLNIAHYPAALATLRAVEPSATCIKLAQPRIAQSSTAIDMAGLDGQHLNLPSEACDGVLSTWTMCTIPDLDSALKEIRRVLKPGGFLFFVEHGHAPDEPVARWQQALEPVTKRMAGGCHLTRNIPAAIEKAGLTTVRLDTYYFQRDLKPFAYTYEGKAMKA